MKSNSEGAMLALLSFYVKCRGMGDRRGERGDRRGAEKVDSSLAARSLGHSDGGRSEETVTEDEARK
eukprot:1114779-Rhodomonas_salina.3